MVSSRGPVYAYAVLTGSMLFIAMNHVIGRGIHEIAPPVGLSFWRWCIAAVVMLPLIGPRLPATLAVYRRAWKVFALLGFLMVGSTTLFLVTLQVTTAINVAVINALQPATTVILTWLFLRHRLSGLQSLGIVLGFLGVLAMLSQGSWQVLATLSFNPGDVLAVVSVLGLSSYAIGLRWLPEGLSAVDALFGIVVGGCAVLLPIYLAEWLLAGALPVTAETIGAILVMGIFGSLAGNLGWNTGNRILGPNRASVFINLIPLFGALLAVPLLGEQLHIYHLAGFATIGMGVLFVLGRAVTDAPPAAAARE